jgi:hypothetical protein
MAFLQQVSAGSELAGWLRPFLPGLQAIVAGSRDRTLADDPELFYRMAAEILFLLETLDQPTFHGDNRTLTRARTDFRIPPEAEPLEELVLELTDLKLHDEDGVRTGHRRVLDSCTSLRQRARRMSSPTDLAIRRTPIGPDRGEELRWYLEKFAVWPSDSFRDRARKVEENLVRWGQLLYEAGCPPRAQSNVLQAWAQNAGHAGRRFSVEVDASLEDGAANARPSSSGLPWELLHDGDAFLFQGRRPVSRPPPDRRACVRWTCRSSTQPIRILLVTARPEDDTCGYIDHRASALPLVSAMEAAWELSSASTCSSAYIGCTA